MLTSTDITPDNRDTDRPPFDERDATVTELERHLIGEMSDVTKAVVVLRDETRAQYNAVTASLQRVHTRLRAGETTARLRHSATERAFASVNDKLDAITTGIEAERRFRARLDSVHEDQIETLSQRVGRLSWVVTKAVAQMSGFGIAAAVAQYLIQHLVTK